MRKIIKAIKYGGYYAVLEELIESLLKKDAISADFLSQKPLLIPVPLHYKRQRVRGFNQAAKIARILGKHWQLSCSQKILQRHKSTHFQAELTKKERQLNIKNAFSPTREIIEVGDKPLLDQPILLIDDVWTTGETLQACAKVCNTLGAKKIWAFTIAR